MCRICKEHITALSFRKGGELVRFCQRCGHAHELAEFDGKHKVCRLQRERHNARRCAGFPGRVVMCGVPQGGGWGRQSPGLHARGRRRVWAGDGAVGVKESRLLD